MKFNLRFFFGLFLSVLLVGCEKNDNPVPPPLEGSRTVLVYIVADKNGLDENYNNQDFATRDVEEMLEGMKSVDTSLYNLLVYLDNNDKPVLFRIDNNKGKVSKEIIKEYDEQVSTETSVMAEVLKRAFSEYRADSYGLVYWSHCDGWIPYPLEVPKTRWVGQDLGDGNDNRMNISGLMTALDSAPAKFDFIMFDACFMMSVEVAYELRNYTDYYIGNPTENPGPGAPYDKIVPAMFAPNAAVNMAAEYFNVYNSIYDGGVNLTNSNWTAGTSITVLKTSELENLASATKEVLQSSVDLSKLRSDVFDYDKRTGEYQDGHVGYYDMQEMMQYILSDNSAAYDAWKKSFDASVAYWNTTDKNYSMFAKYRFDSIQGMFPMKPNAHGVAHYIPSASTSYIAGVTNAAYRTTAWYNAAGLSKLGW